MTSESHAHHKWENIRMRLRFFWYHIKRPSNRSLVVLIVTSIIEILGFILLDLELIVKIVMAIRIFGIAIVWVLLDNLYRTITKGRKARKLLLAYLANLKEQYSEKLQELNLIDRTIEVANKRAVERAIGGEGLSVGKKSVYYSVVPFVLG